MSLCYNRILHQSRVFILNLYVCCPINYRRRCHQSTLIISGTSSFATMNTRNTRKLASPWQENTFLDQASPEVSYSTSCFLSGSCANIFFCSSYLFFQRERSSHVSLLACILKQNVHCCSCICQWMGHDCASILILLLKRCIVLYPESLNVNIVIVELK